MPSLVKSRLRYEARVQTAAFLRALGVDFREDKAADDGTIMRANAHVLPEIYEEMQAAVHERMQQLHPDKGGDHGEFVVLVADYRAVQKRFRRYLPVALPRGEVKVRPVKNALKAKQAKARREKDPAGFRAKRRALYAKQKAEGTLWKRKNKPKRSKESKARQAKAGKIWRKKNIVTVRRWRRNFHWRHRDRILSQKKLKKYAEGRNVVGSRAWERRQKWLAKRNRERRRRRAEASVLREAA